MGLDGIGLRTIQIDPDAKPMSHSCRYTIEKSPRRKDPASSVAEAMIEPLMPQVSATCDMLFVPNHLLFMLAWAVTLY